MHYAREPRGAPQDVDRLLEDLRTLDLLGPVDIARVLPELEHARARLWLSMLTSTRAPLTHPGEPSPELLTVKEVADRLRFSRGHIYELLRTGQLRGIKNGRAIRITREALAEWQAAHEADRLDGSPRGSGQSPLHDEPRASAGHPHLRGPRAPSRRSQLQMKRSR